MTGLVVFLTALGALVGSAAPNPAVAQEEVIPLTLEDALSVNEFLVNGGAPRFSPDGSRIAYVLCDSGRRDETPRDSVIGIVATRGAAMYTLGCDVWTSSIEGGTQKNVSGAVGNSWGGVWSPDGTRIAFYSDRGGKVQLFVHDLATGRARPISGAKMRVRVGTERPIWLPDGDRIVVRLWPEGVSDAELGERSPGPAEGVAPESGSEKESTVVVYRSGDVAVGRGDKSGAEAPPAALRKEIGIVSVASGEVRRVVSPFYGHSAKLSPDGRHLLLSRWDGNRPAGQMVSPTKLDILDIADERERTLVSGALMEGGVASSWSPDGRWIAYLDASGVPGREEAVATGPGVYSWGQLHLVPTDGGEPKKMTPTAEIHGFDLGNDLRPLWSASGQAIYLLGEDRVWKADPATGEVSPFSETSDLELASIVSLDGSGTVWAPSGAEAVVMARRVRTGETGLYKVMPDGSLVAGVTEMKKYAYRAAAPVASPGGRHLIYQAESATRPSELWATTSAFSTPSQITHANPQFDQYVLGEARLIDYLGADGEPLQAALLLPAGYEEGERYPLITLVYASAMGSRRVNDFGLQNVGQYQGHLLTTRGYAILHPDIPVKVGSPMLDLMKGVMPAIDKVIEMGIADPDRLGVTGQSNGGYSTLSLIVQTNRFEAAVMNAGFGDLTGFYGSMIEADGSGGWHPWLEQLGGGMKVPPWEDPMRYMENSPIYYLDRITTPLIIQAGGDDDSIVPFSDQVFVGLKRLDKDVSYLRYGGEGHLLEDRANQIDYWDRVFEFWDRHLKWEAEAPTPPAATPGPPGSRR